MNLSIPTKVWFLGSLVEVWSWTAWASVVWIIFLQFVGWALTRSTAVPRALTWWAVVCGWSAVWPVRCVTVGSVTAALVCWMGSPWAASIVALPIPLLWFRVASVQVIRAGAAMSAIPGLWSAPAFPFSIFLAVSRAWSGVAVSVWLVMLCWCPWRWYFVRASMSICLYSSHSWHLMWGQCHALCPGSWHWKHWSFPLYIMLTVEDGRMVAVSCCAALSFSVMASFSVCGSFSYILAARLCVFLSPFMKILIMAVSFVKLQHFASVLNWWT